MANYIVVRGFQGPVDESGLVEQARLFGELLVANKEPNVLFDAYFAASYGGNINSKEEIWFITQ